MRSKIIILILISLSLTFCASSQKRIEQSKEKNPQYQYNLGLYYLNNNELDQAIKYFDKSLSLNPRYFVSFYGRGLAYSMKGNLEESQRSFQKCLEISPQFSEARNALGMVYQELGYLDKAAEEFSKAMADPNYNYKELPAFNLAKLYLTQNKPDQALDYARKSTGFNNRYALGHNLEGFLLEKLDRLPEAIASYEKAVKLVPDEVSFSFNLGAAYFKNEEFRKAEEVFLRILPKTSDADQKAKINDFLKSIKEKSKETP